MMAIANRIQFFLGTGYPLLHPKRIPKSQLVFDKRRLRPDFGAGRGLFPTHLPDQRLDATCSSINLIKGDFIHDSRAILPE